MAFSENVKTFVNTAIHVETEEAVAKWGKTYSSLHEGYAVLKEEVDEVRDENIHIKNGLYSMWDSVKTNDVKKEDVEKIREHAEKLALEAVQVAAVCNKILNGLQ